MATLLRLELSSFSDSGQESISLVKDLELCQIGDSRRDSQYQVASEDSLQLSSETGCRSIAIAPAM